MRSLTFRAFAVGVLLSSAAVAAAPKKGSSGSTSHATSHHAAAPKAPTSAAPADAGSGKGKPDRKARITLGTGDLAPVPLVRGTLAGRPTWILLDSGASVHVVAGWAARKAHLPTRRAGDAVLDHGGVPMAGRRADLAAVAIDGWGALRSAPMMVLEQDAGGLGARAGIGVVLSPQLLATKKETVLLDLASGELRVVDDAEATRVLASKPNELAKDVAGCGGIYSVAAAVDGRRANMVVDTGAASSDLSLGARAAQRLASRSAPSVGRHDAASGALFMRTVHGVRLRVGEHAVAVDLGLFAEEPDPVCPTDGDLGVDALKSCVLVFAGEPTKMSVRCDG